MTWKKIMSGHYQSGEWTIEHHDSVGRYRWLVYRGKTFVASAMTLAGAKRMAEKKAAWPIAKGVL